jgi:hypothetical protein
MTWLERARFRDYNEGLVEGTGLVQSAFCVNGVGEKGVTWGTVLKRRLQNLDTMVLLESVHSGNPIDGLVEGIGPKLVLFEGLLCGYDRGKLEGMHAVGYSASLHLCKKKKKNTPRPINCLLITAFGFYSSRSNVHSLSGLGVPNHISSGRLPGVEVDNFLGIA